MFNYVGSGNINLTGCYAAFKSINFTTKYTKGDVVFLKKKAKKGILESVAIKDVRILGGGFSSNQITAIYTDTYNFLYNEDELLYPNEAYELKNNYCILHSNFKHNSNVKINLHSCNGYDPQPPITTKFQIGDIVFLKKKAAKGILESIFIKNIKVLKEINCNKIYGLYLDNTNFYYNEDELVTELEAKNLMKEFVINKINTLNNSKIKCGFKNIVAKCK